MTGLDLRPLSMGEILDRTFSLYRRYFVLFVGISAIPQILVLALRLAQILLLPPTYSSLSSTIWLGLVILVASLVAYLLSQGGTVLAVSELYLGRPTTIGESLRRVWNEIGSIFGVVFLNSLVIGVGLILFIVPGIYLACRLLVCVPAAMIEKRGARESLERSFDLTRDNAVRSFLILLLSVVLSWAAQMLLSAPFTLMIALNRTDFAMLRIWMACSQIGASLGSILIGPILLIATSVYYYDLRVRKEAFDLQIMLDPDSQAAPRTGPPSILS
jgi:hypothetical protein